MAQPVIFLLTIYGGIFLGMVYDVYRCLKKLLKCGRWMVFLFDALFVLTMGGIIAAVLFLANQGELRLYTIVGFAMGFAMYMAGISPLMQYLIKKIRQHHKDGRSKD